MHERDNQQAQVIERTAKRWRRWQAAGMGLILIGFALAFGLGVSSMQSAGVIVAGVGMGGGLAVFLVGAIGAWWHHG